MNQPTFQVKQEEKKGDWARFVMEPLEQGYGHTLGSSLRRVMLTSLPGAAITSVRVTGLKHQFGAVKGVKEDGVDLILNLKQVRFLSNSEKPARATLTAQGKGEVVAGQIKTPAQTRVVNPDLHIATLADSKSKLDIELVVERGVGYSPAEDRKSPTLGVIPLDADFSPVKRVNYKVEETRVGRLTNYDKLTLEIWTDGQLPPQDALKQAAKILQTYVDQIITPVPSDKKEGVVKSKVEDALGNLSVEELGLPTRISNALVKAGYETVADMVERRSELSKVRNLGGKSVKIIDTALKEKGVSLEE